MKKISHRKFVLIFIMLCLVTGCGSVPTTPHQPQVATPTIALSTLTSTAAPTSTPAPTATEKPATSTLTPEPGLQTNGPYFAYFQQEDLISRLVFLDADGRGRMVIDLPKTLGVKSLDMRRVSPDGRWLAFYTGNAGRYGELPTVGRFDLALNLFDLKTGETQVITPLLSKDYPDNFIKAAKELNDPNVIADSLYQAFVDGITRAIAWSPDGRYLAFAGQMDGLSSDLYVYEVQTKTIRRLSSGDQELQWLSWSPDGKWIVHSSVYSVGLGMTYDIYVASVDGLLQHLSTNILDNGIENWLNDHQYFENDGENGPGPYGLRLVDINTGNITRIWDGAFTSYVVDKSRTWVALLATSPNSSPYDSDHNLILDFDFVPEIYLINLATLEKSRVAFPDVEAYTPIESFGLKERAFVVLGQNPIFLTENRSLIQTDLGIVNISVSPNSEYWLAVGDDLKIYSADNTLVKSVAVSLPIYASFSWRPDSSGVFLISESEIHSVNVPEGDTELIETNLMDGQGLYYGWISGQ